MPLRDGFFSTATQTSCCNRIQRSNRVRLLVVSTHDFPDRSTGHIMVTTRYSDQQGSKSRQKVMRLYKRWHRPITKRFIKPPIIHIESSLDRLGLFSPTHDQRSTNRTNMFQLDLINSSKFLKATHRTKIMKIEIPRSMVVEALSW